MYILKFFVKDEPNEVFINMIKILAKEYDNILNKKWKIHKGAYAGYGIIACHIENEVQKSEYLDMYGRDIYKALVSEKEYFYNICITLDYLNIKLGIFDSSYAYIQSDNYEMILKILRYHNFIPNFKIELTKSGYQE